MDSNNQQNSNCSISLWRVVRGSKLMHLELIHGLFITSTEFRLSTTFISGNYYYAYIQLVSFKRSRHSIYTRTQITIYMAHSPCFLSPLADSLLLPFLTPFYLLGTLLAVTGSVHLGLRLLVNWPPLSQPSPQSLPPPNSQNPGYQAPHYDDLKTPASSVRNTNNPLIGWTFSLT
jgi:hypothetical protein